MSGLVCTKCGETKEAAEFPVASVTKSGRAGECKQCKSVRQKQQYLDRAMKLYNMLGRECHDCGCYHDEPAFFDFHHIDKTTKHREVKQILNGSWDKIMTEVDKCVMLCPNCHRERHLKEGW